MECAISLEIKHAFQIDLLIYQKEAILNAAHKFLNRVHIQLESVPDHSIKVIIYAQECELNELEREFWNELVDQQVRLNIQKNCGNIRDLIVKQAFKPVDDIASEIKI